MVGAPPVEKMLENSEMLPDGQTLRLSWNLSTLPRPPPGLSDLPSGHECARFIPAQGCVPSWDAVPWLFGWLPFLPSRALPNAATSGALPDRPDHRSHILLGPS